jgi:hypothetical protein
VKGRQAATLVATMATLWAAHPPLASAYGVLLPQAAQDGDAPPGLHVRDVEVIFEEGDEETTVHVLVGFEGRPLSLAWVVPVPEAAEVGSSDPLLFDLLDELTRPVVAVREESLCPSPMYLCTSHPPADCNGRSGEDAHAEPSDAGSGNEESDPFLSVVPRQVANTDQGVLLAAEDASEIVQWLRDEGFHADDTVAARLQPYLEAGMALWVATVAPAPTDRSLHPLRITYPSSVPTLPLRVTSLGAEPEMSVTIHIFGGGPHGLAGNDPVEIDPLEVTFGRNVRPSYPMVLSRAVDAAGGRGFVTEFAGVMAPFVERVGEDDAALLAVAEWLEQLAAEHAFVTRLTTRMSPHEMARDPVFEPVAEAPVDGQAAFEGARFSLRACRHDVLSPRDAEHIWAIRNCAAAYCGAGKCVVTDAGGAGCECEPGHVAREIRDTAGLPSVTCAPATRTEPATSSGICAGVDCGLGTCVDLEGFAACLCDDGAAAESSGAGAPHCLPVQTRSGSAGGENFSRRLRDMPVCAPPPATDCGWYGWLVPNPEPRIVGLECITTPDPNPALLQMPPPPLCPSGCSAAGPGAGHRHGWLALCGLLTALLIGARRRSGGGAQL